VRWAASLKCGLRRTYAAPEMERMIILQDVLLKATARWAAEIR
jgi:hypothetical protein